MHSVSVEGLTKRFGHRGSEVVALDQVTLRLEPGELLVLVGPSGCGKTTLLRCIAGLEHANDGRIAIGDDVVFDAARRVVRPSYKRDIGMVFQQYALWPHMSVRKNVEFPLRARRQTEAIAAGAVDDALAIVQCEELADRIPAALSGGQQQRIAVARALVAHPGVVLFDEPLSNLDALLKLQTREEVRQLHRRVGFTAVYVTHDQSEALSIGDRVAVMRAGRIEQLGTPAEIFDTPATPEVARFLGVRNEFELTGSGSGWTTELGPLGGGGNLDLSANGSFGLFVRPESLRLTRGLAIANGRIRSDECVLGEGRIRETLFSGAVIEYVVEAAGKRLIAIGERGPDALGLDEHVVVSFDPHHALLYATGNLVRPESARVRVKSST